MHKLLSEKIISLAKARGFASLTEIQERALPVIYEGNDALIIAPTGYGKTEAVLFPLLSRMLELQAKGETQGIQTIYITPLRALNRDMLSRVEYWCTSLGITFSVRHGDTSSREREKQRDAPPQLLITTPETLASVLIAPKLSDSLRNTRFVVVDEVHELVETKRGAQLSLSIARLKRKCNPQIIGLSATVSNEGDVAKFLSPKATIVKLALARQMKYSVHLPAEDEEGKFGVLPTGIIQTRVERIVELLRKHKRVLIFVNTRYMAEALGSLLHQISELRDHVAVHHSSLAKEVRVDVEDRFKRGELKAIICTSSLELGIDIGAIDLVIQFISPRRVARLVQRVGRSGHKFDAVPEGVVITSDPLDYLEASVLASRAKAHALEPLRVREGALDVLAHGICGLCLDQGIIREEEALAVLRTAYPYRNVSPEDFHKVVEQLAAQRCILVRDGYLSKGGKTKLFYYENVSTIADKRKVFVKDSLSRKNVAVLDEEFVAAYIQKGATFISKGVPWKVLVVDQEEIIVERADDFGSAVPEWQGEDIPVDREVAYDVRDLLHGAMRGEITLGDRAGEKVVLEDFLNAQRAFFTPSKKEVFLEAKENLFILHTFLGSKANECFSRLVASYLTSLLGSPVRTSSSAYTVLFELPRAMELQRFLSVLKSIHGDDVDRTMRASLFYTPLYLHRFAAVAKRFGLLKKEFDYERVSLKRIAAAHKDSSLAQEAFNEVFFEKMSVVEAAEFFEQLHSGKVAIVPLQGFSPLAVSFLEFNGFAELIAPPEPTSKLISAFKENLLSKRAELFCIYCSKTFSRSLRELRASVVCPFCGSNQITLEDYSKAVVKQNNLSEMKEASDGYKVASLVSANGAKALIALSTYGVGPTTAARVLSRMHAKEEDFYRDLIQAQKDFIKNKRYWRA